MVKTHVKKGDLAVVISGNFRSERGKVLTVLPGKGQVIIEGVHLIKKTVRKSQDHPQGGFVEREGPIHISNVMLAELYDKRHAVKVKGP